MHGSLDRNTLVELLEEVDRELQFRRARAQIYVIGGAAMSLAYARERTTADIDARVEKGHSALLEAVRTVARRRGLPDSWLNEQATTAIPRTMDGNPRTLYASEHLTVTGASPRHLLAMKLQAGRTKDEQDIAVLVAELGLASPAEAMAVHDELFPDEPLDRAKRELIERVFGNL
ncbi:MAG: DUF6036 family nucleotidyltransferase [Acidobacteria bacterium]|nr:DUF6036 family nucleotidyltransferase [Acidobacteriota bacterium]